MVMELVGESSHDASGFVDEEACAKRSSAALACALPRISLLEGVWLTKKVFSTTASPPL